MNKLIKISIWLTLSELAFSLSGYVIHSFLGRFLGPAEYGRFSLIITFSTMIIILIGRGIPISMSKYLSEVFENKEEVVFIKKRAAFLQFILIGIITLAYFLLSPVFAKLLKDESLTDLFRISSLIIPSFALAAFYVSYFNGIHQFGKQSALKFIRAGARVALILGLGYLYKTGGAIIGQAIAPLSVFFSALFLDPFRKTKTILEKTKEEIFQMDKKLLSFAWPIILFFIFYELMITLDLYLIKAILQDDYQTGLYSSALTIARIPFFCFYFLSILLLPKISQTTANGMNEKTKKILTFSFRFMLMLLIPSVLLLSRFSSSAIEFFYGQKYLPATTATSLLVFGIGFLTIFYIITFVLNGAGRNKLPMFLAFLGAICNGLLNFLLIPKYGIVGSAWATIITGFLVMIPAIVYTTKKVAPFLQFWAISKYLFAGMIIYFLSGYFSQDRFIFILWSILLLLAYFLILFILKELKREDWEFFSRSLKKSKN